MFSIFCVTSFFSLTSPISPSLRSSISSFKDQEMGSIDPQLERQVETIRNLVESYYSIVSSTVRDVVPKSIMHTMVNKLKDYMKGDLLPMIYAAGNQDNMMEESQEAAKRRDEMVHMYHTCKDALALISDVSTKTCVLRGALCWGAEKGA